MRPSSLAGYALRFSGPTRRESSTEKQPICLVVIVSCPFCHLGFRNQQSSRQHQEVAHGAKLCVSCDIPIIPEELSAHWRDSEKHPTCCGCGDGFETDVTYENHFQLVHKSLWCDVCRLPFANQAALEQHYLFAPEHPSCTKCSKGFKQQAGLIAHNTLVHQHAPPQPSTSAVVSERYRCELCKREFRLALSLAAHYHDSPAHPTCQLCNIGFKDGSSFEQHVLATHPPEPAPASPDAVVHALSTPTPAPIPVLDDTRSSSGESVEPEVSPTVKPTVVVSPSTPRSTGAQESYSPRSDELELQQTRHDDPVNPSPRAVSEPSLSFYATGRNDRPTLSLGTSGISPVSPALAEEGSIVTQGGDPFSAISGQALSYASAHRSSLSTPELIRSPTLSESSVSQSEVDVAGMNVVANSTTSRTGSRRSTASASVHSLREITETNAPNSRSSSRSRTESSHAPSRLSTPVSHYEIVVSPATDIAARRRERDIYSRSTSRMSTYSPVPPIPSIGYTWQAPPPPAIPGPADSQSRAREEEEYLGITQAASRTSRPSSRFGVSSAPADAVRESHRLGDVRSESRLDDAVPTRPGTRLSRTSNSHLKQSQHSVLPSPPSSSSAHRPSSRVSRASLSQGQTIIQSSTLIYAWS
ncbi:hypothetical protein EIP91_002233 [Steccherinum ochraceum]|uniref:C2H2-type domain-containing protein n=1 Tax=Steccherinum ochraceum TaxID=92696 RepID=A0A4R0RKY8_9APHY|nr:hypothetical protein EIP91_002233 [Steccherinum ochraceum]